MLYKADGFDLDHPEQFRRHEIDVDWACYIEISPDGRWIWFKERGVLTQGHWMLFDVAGGTMRSMDATEIWERREFGYERHGTRLPLEHIQDAP